MLDLRLPIRLERRIAERRKRLDEQRPLAASVVHAVRGDLRVLLTYHSNAIEGNTLNVSETQMVIEHGITIGGDTVKEHLEAINHAEAIALLYELAERGAAMTHADITQLHALITAKLLPSAGQYRDGPVSIRGSRLGRHQSRSGGGSGAAKPPPKNIYVVYFGGFAAKIYNIMGCGSGAGASLAHHPPTFAAQISRAARNLSCKK